MVTNERFIFALYLAFILSAVLIIIFLAFSFVLCKALLKTEKGALKTLSLMISRSGGLQILTVMMIGISILLLRAAEMISADATISALTGISGFVLGGLAEKQAKSGGTPVDGED